MGLGIKSAIWVSTAVKELKLKTRIVLSSYLPSKAAAGVWQKEKSHVTKQ